MRIIFSNEKLESQCTSVKEATGFFGGNVILARSLLACVNSLIQAENMKDIIACYKYHFHKLINKKRRNLEGYFAIDVKTRKEQWRIIVQPLDDDLNVFKPCNIDEIAGIVKVLEIVEVTKHYE